MNTVESAVTSMGKVFSELGTTKIVLILLAPLLLYLLILVPIMAFRGYKKGLFLSLISLGASIVSYIAAVLLSKPISMLLGKLIYGIIRDNAFTEENKAGVIFDSSGYLTDFAKGLLTAASAIIIFGLVFFILLLLSKLILGAAFRKKLEVKEEQKGLKWGGAGIRALDAVLLSFMFLVPLYAFVGSAAVSLKNVTTELKSDEYSTVELEDPVKYHSDLDCIDRCADAMSDPLPVKVSGRSFIGFYYNFVGSFSSGGKSGNVYRLLEDSTLLFTDALPLVVKIPEAYGEYEKIKIDQAVTQLKNEAFFSGLTADFLNHFDELIEVGDHSDKKQNDLMNRIFSKLKGTTLADVDGALDALGDSAKALIDHKVFKSEVSFSDSFANIRDKTLIERLDRNLRSSSMLSRITDTMLEEVFGSLKDIDLDLDPSQRSTLTGVCDEIVANMKKNTVDSEEEIYLESASLVRIIGALSIFDNKEGLTDADISTVNTDALADLFVGIGVHPYSSPDQAAQILTILLPTFGDQANAVFTDKMLDSVKSTIISDVNAIKAGEQGESLRNLLRSTKNMALAVQNMRGYAMNSKEKLQDAVDDLLKNMNKESASIIIDTINGAVIENLGGDVENSEQISDFVSDLVNNIAESDGSNEADKKAISDLSTLVMNATESFNEGGEAMTLKSAVGGDLKEFVDTASRSGVVMSTVAESVRKNGSDPTGGFKNLSESDLTDLRVACKDVYLESGQNAEKLEALNEILAFFGAEKLS